MPTPFEILRAPVPDEQLDPIVARMLPAHTVAEYDETDNERVECHVVFPETSS